MKIVLRQSGGLAGLDREIVIDGTTLTVTDHGFVSSKGELPESDVQLLTKLVEQLRGANPRQSYGRSEYSDSLTTAIAVDAESGPTAVEVRPDPADLAPDEFWAAVDGLRGVASIGEARQSFKAR